MWDLRPPTQGGFARSQLGVGVRLQENEFQQLFLGLCIQLGTGPSGHFYFGRTCSTGVPVLGIAH